MDGIKAEGRAAGKMEIGSGSGAGGDNSPEALALWHGTIKLAALAAPRRSNFSLFCLFNARRLWFTGRAAALPG